jgi:hypothetical protein
MALSRLLLDNCFCNSFVAVVVVIVIVYNSGKQFASFSRSESANFVQQSQDFGIRRS